jgi:glycosyltransferase involved in cell wall biosynthesis
MSMHLVLFFTKGVSVRTWAMMGMLAREIAIYRRFIAKGFRVSFVTYGDAGDLDYSEQLSGIEILCNAHDLPLEDYESRLFSLHENTLRDCCVIKTNQTFGAELALDVARFFKKPFVARCGYMWSKNTALEKGYDSPEAVHARAVEERVFTASHRVLVTTEAMKADVASRIPSAASKTVVIPNYVDTEVFKPDALGRDENSLLFVGRIAPEKNLDSLLEAIRPLEAKLVLIGEGRLRPELQKRFGTLDGRVTWEGNVPNAELPGYINRATAFVLPSLYEGHPKALLEAMSCGTPVIGTNSSGIKELIRHGANGYLCGTDAVSLRKGIHEVLTRPDLRSELGRNARQFVLDNYALEKIAAIEAELLRNVADQPELVGPSEA